MREKRN